MLKVALSLAFLLTAASANNALAMTDDYGFLIEPPPQRSVNICPPRVTRASSTVRYQAVAPRATVARQGGFFRLFR
ncbi:MAG: hypothetical protein AAGJ46_20030 [Planctomycetota bacterium]